MSVEVAMQQLSPWCSLGPLPEHWRHQRRAGQSLVELAIVLPLLALLIFGGIDAVQVLMTNYTVERAVRAAAHQAALDGGASSAVNTVAELILDSGIGMR